MAVVTAPPMEPWSSVPGPIIVARLIVVPATIRRESHVISAHIEIGYYKDHNQED